jgi:predicted DNA-binding transcriptional regulator YafY
LLKNLSFYFLEDYLASAAFTSTEAFAAVVSATAVAAVSTATAAVSATTGVSAAASVAFPPQDANTTHVIAKNNAFFIVFLFVFFLLYTYICFY